MKAVKLTASAAAAVAVLALAKPSSAQTLVISSWAPPSHPINSEVWPGFGKCLGEATGGKLKIQLKYRLASPPRQFDVVAKGVADGAWIFHGYNASRYLATMAVEIPLLGTKARPASIAYWRVHVKYLAKAREHKGVHLISLHTHGPAILQTRKRVARLAQLKGMKIRIPSVIAGKALAAFGGTGVKAPAPKVYEYLSTGVADGVMMPIETQLSFKLAEVAKYNLIVPGGIYYGSFGFILNPRKLLSLSEASQNAVRSCGGEKFAALASSWDRADDRGLAHAKKVGNPVIVGGAAIKAEFAPVAKSIEDWWVAEATKKGIEARRALDELRSIARSLK